MTSDKIMVSDLSAADETLGKVEQWIQEFPADIQVALRQWYKKETHVVTPDDDLAVFRMQPLCCLKKVEDRIKLLATSNNALLSVRIVWMLENRENRGLDDFEAEAVFGQWMTIDLLYQHERGAKKSRLLVCGRLREEIAGLSFRLDLPCDLKGVMAGLDALADTGMSFTLFIGHDAAAWLMSNPDNPLPPRIRSLIDEGWLSPGLWVPSHRMEAALDNMTEEIAPVRSLAGENCAVSMVRFAETASIAVPQRLRRAMTEAGISWDSSLVATGEVPGSRETVRNGPYLRGGAYVSQPFDIRTPAGFIDEAGIHELIIFPLAPKPAESALQECRAQVAEQWRQWWDWRCGRDQERLLTLLDFKRMETYFRQMVDSPALYQTYHEYRVYNWPEPDPTPRITFIDGGELGNQKWVRAVIDRITVTGENAGRNLRLVNQAQLLEIAEDEVAQRLVPLETVLKSQVAAHEYLKTLPSDQPLRQDIADFVNFIPNTIGRTLELGSGYGQLATQLSSRAQGYICSDLGQYMFGGIVGDQRYGVVADAHHLPFCPEVFNTIIANNILEHLYNPLKALQEVHRVLKQGGRLYALIPLDALNPAHELRSHLWKADAESIRNALRMAFLEPLRLEVIDLYAMGIKGSFPTCNGLVCKVEATKLMKDEEC